MESQSSKLSAVEEDSVVAASTGLKKYADFASGLHNFCPQLWSRRWKMAYNIYIDGLRDTTLQDLIYVRWEENFEEIKCFLPIGID